METDHVHGGAFQIARKLFESDLWENKPATWKVIWIYILGNVNHKQNEHFERGEGFFNFSKDLRKVGNDITEDMVKKFCVYARNNEMISTERSTRGMRIKVLNYNKYQTMGTYLRTSLGTSQARAKHEPSTPINKNDKNDKNTSAARVVEVTEGKKDPKNTPEMLSFYEIFSHNPARVTWKARTVQRNSAAALLEAYGFDECVRRYQVSQKYKNEPMCPQFDSPVDMLEKMVKMETFLKNL